MRSCAKHIAALQILLRFLELLRLQLDDLERRWLSLPDVVLVYDLDRALQGFRVYSSAKVNAGICSGLPASVLCPDPCTAPQIYSACSAPILNNCTLMSSVRFRSGPPAFRRRPFRDLLPGPARPFRSSSYTSPSRSRGTRLESRTKQKAPL